MCVIVVKPQNAILDKDNLENCFDANPQGAGFAVAKDNGSTILKKGYFKFDEFWKDVEEYIKPEDVAILHCRIATHGNKDEGNTHPFIISDKDEDLRNTYCVTTRSVAAHNGVLRNCIPEFKSILSDSQEFVKKILSDPFIYEGLFHSQPMRDLISEYLGSLNKLAILSPEREYILFGTFLECKGIKYSNSSYIRTYSEKDYYDNWYKDINSNKNILPKTESKKDDSIKRGTCALCDQHGLIEFITEVPLCQNCIKALGSEII
jgi:hypothetical protein